MTNDEDVSSHRDIIDMISQRFDAQEKLLTQMFNTHAVRLNTVETILASRDTDHKQIETNVLDKLLPKLDHIAKNLDAHLAQEDKDKVALKSDLNGLFERIRKVEEREAEKSRAFLERLKNIAIGWIVPILLVILVVWVRDGLPIPGDK